MQFVPHPEKAVAQVTQDVLDTTSVLAAQLETHADLLLLRNLLFEHAVHVVLFEQVEQSVIAPEQFVQVALFR